jgi:hypothetical protein
MIAQDIMDIAGFMVCIKKWYCNIAEQPELCDAHTVLIVTRNHAGKNKYKEIVDFLESQGQ